MFETFKVINDQCRPPASHACASRWQCFVSINEFASVVADSEGKKIMIDHHLDPVGFEDLAFWDNTASSTAEMVYRLIDQFDAVVRDEKAEGRGL